jgi:sensor domain CHASE-containing protein
MRYRPDKLPTNKLRFMSTSTANARVALPHQKRGVVQILIGTLTIASLLAALNVALLTKSLVENKRIETRTIAQGYAQRLQDQIQNAMVSTYVLASVIKQNGGRTDTFDETATELITMFPSVSALQLAPDGVIQHIVPRKGNEAAIGHDLLTDKLRNREAAAAITLRQLTLAGPFELVQGGMGAVGRLPVFLKKPQNDNHFWGFAIALIRIPRLIESAGLGSLARAGYQYELWRIHPETEKRQIFARNSDQDLGDPVDYVVTIYGGRWVLSIAPENGWISPPDVLPIVGLNVVGILGVVLLQYLGIRLLLLRRKPATGVNT